MVDDTLVIADTICREVAELPDRTSPADQPDMMLVSHDELRAIVLAALANRAATAAPDVEALARVVNRARYPDDRTPRELEDEDRSGQEYARRIARAVAAYYSPVSAPSKEWCERAARDEAAAGDHEIGAGALARDPVSPVNRPVPSGEARRIADDLERLCCAETEAKFFDYVTESIGTIIAILRASPDKDSVR